MPSSYKLTKEQARRLMLLYHGLRGEHRYEGERGVLQLFAHLSAIQFDPIDVCGRNADIVLHSRVKGYKKEYLYNLLYQSRELVDYFDKCMCIVPREDWHLLKGRMMYYYNTPLGEEKIVPITSKIKEIITERGAVCSADLEFNERVDWYWGDAKLSRAALEYLYYKGEIMVHHKVGTTKYYDLTERCIPAKIIDFTSDTERKEWYILRRIRAVGLMWDRASDVWLNIEGLRSKERSEILASLCARGELIEIAIEGFAHRFFAPVSSLHYIESVLNGEDNLIPRCEFIAPLDSFIWDRKLIKELFDFDYKWEIYTPKAKRKYGHYVLPIVYGTEFIGRIEMICDRKNRILTVQNIWIEQRTQSSPSLCNSLKKSISNFAEFNSCSISDG